MGGVGWAGVGGWFEGGGVCVLLTGVSWGGVEGEFCAGLFGVGGRGIVGGVPASVLVYLVLFLLLLGEGGILW